MPIPSTNQNSLDVLKINNSEALVGLIDDATKRIPEISFFHASPIKRNVYNTLVLTQDPKVGFRTPGDFAAHESPILKMRTTALKFPDASWEMDTALAEQTDWGKEEALAIQALTHLRSAFATLAQQIWYGVKNEADGFRGLYELIGVAAGDERSNQDLHIDVKTLSGADTSAAANTGLSSVFAVSTGIDSIQLAWGSEGRFTEGDIEKVRMHNPSNPKNSGAWYYGQELSGWVGLQVTSAHAFGRIHNLSKVNPLNDEMLYELISRFPGGREPQAFFMTRRSLEQLRKSRVAFHPTGAPVELMDSVAGIPIIVTDAIVNNEETVLV
jgi:hypothetical protein